MSWRARLHRALVRQAHWRLSLVVRIGLDEPDDHEQHIADVAAAARVAFHGGRYRHNGHLLSPWHSLRNAPRGSEHRQMSDDTRGWFARFNLKEEPATGKQRARWRRLARRAR